MERIELGYKKARLIMEYLPEERKVLMDVSGEKEWELGGKKVPPLKGQFLIHAQRFIELLEGVWGIDTAKSETEEGIVVVAEYDWEGWRRGDDILKLKFTKYPEERTIFYLHRWNVLILSAFIKYVKNRMGDYGFKSRDLQFIRSEGETIISQAGEEIIRFSVEETRALRSMVENALLKGLSFPVKGIDFSAYPKARWIFSPTVEQPKPLYKLYMCVV